MVRRFSKHFPYNMRRKIANGKQLHMTGYRPPTTGQSCGINIRVRLTVAVNEYTTLNILPGYP